MSMSMLSKKNLVYFTLGHDPEYVNLTKFCLYSMLLNSPNISNRLDVMIMCDESYEPYVRTHIPYAHVFLTDKNESAAQTSMRKLEIFSYPTIDNYEHILYLDGDVVVTKDITELFKLDISNDILYVKKETEDINAFNMLFFGLRAYTEDHMRMFQEKKHCPFNAGHFLFKNSIEMKHHFNNILNMIKEWKGDFFYEQSFMNHYFQLNGKYNTHVLDAHISLYDGVTLTHMDDHATLIHCFKAHLPLDFKLMNMKNIMFHEQKKKQVIVYNSISNLHELINLGATPKMAMVGAFNKDIVDAFVLFKPSKLFLIEPFSVDSRKNELAKNYSTEDFIDVIEHVTESPKFFEPESLDMIYVGDNTSSITRSVMEYAYRSVKNGGWILGHGFNKNGSLYAVFCFDKGLRVNIVFMDENMGYAIKVFK